MTRRGALGAALGVPLALGLVLGAVGGWLWWTWWGPPPVGKIYDTTAGPTWYPMPLDPGIARDFDGTAMYVVVGAGCGLLLGVVGGWFARHRPLEGLAAVLLASVAAAALMTVIGVGQSPADPQDRADEVEIGTKLPGHLHVAGWSPYLVWPATTLLGYTVLMLSLTSAEGRPEHRPSEPTGSARSVG